MDLNTILWITIAASCAASLVSFVKLYIKSKNFKWVILSFISYVILFFAYSIILVKGDVIIIYSIVKILSILIVVLCGVLIFKEKINLKIGLGILFGLISIYLLSSS
jgi:multidrug transporter EmrE-like cation transporter